LFVCLFFGYCRGTGSREVGRGPPKVENLGGCPMCYELNCVPLKRYVEVPVPQNVILCGNRVIEDVIC
jgi:hypothetical protein